MAQEQDGTAPASAATQPSNVEHQSHHFEDRQEWNEASGEHPEQ